jgi:hypothetical protein
VPDSFAFAVAAMLNHGLIVTQLGSHEFVRRLTEVIKGIFG